MCAVYFCWNVMRYHESKHMVRLACCHSIVVELRWLDCCHGVAFGVTHFVHVICKQEAKSTCHMSASKTGAF